MSGSHDPFLVVFSVVIAVIAAYTALDLAGRVAAASGRERLGWLVAGSVAMGTGIWSMHFVGMLALQLGVPISYDVARVALSAVVAIGASALALSISARPSMTRNEAIGGGVLMGFAIAGMHYIGMSALRANVIVSFRQSLVTLSVLIAISASFVALSLAHRFRTRETRRAEYGTALSAIVMGGAIVGMHYTAMAAVIYTPSIAPAVTAGHLLLTGSTLTASVVLGSLMVLAVTLVASAVHRQGSMRLLAVTRSNELALRAQENFLRQVVDANPSLMFVKDREGRFTLVNRAMAEAYGTTPEAFIGRVDSDFNMREADVSQYLKDDKDVMEQRVTRFIPEGPMRAADGQIIRWFETVKVPLIVEDGAEVQVLGVATDVTDRRQLADQLRQAQKMDAIGQLTGGIAHDLNNILTVILANADLIANGIPEDLDDARRDVKDLQSAASRGADMVRKLLAFSRQEIISLRPVAIEQLMINLKATLVRLLPATIDIDVRADRQVAGVLADEGAIEQMVLNLATNARDAMPDGGRLLISVAQTTLDEEWCSTRGGGKGGAFVSVSVTDTGVGIEAKLRERIFEPFFTTKPAGAGTGLGLSMVYGLMRQHDGFVEVYSEPGVGTSVTLYFPAQGVPPQRRVATPVRNVRGGSETILLAEDEEPIRRSVTRVLERHGYRVYSASDGAAALELLASLGDSVALVISDIVMPNMGGRELYRRLRAANVQVPFLYTSGYAVREVWESSALESEVPFLHKPWAMTDLLNMVRAVIDEARTERP